MGLYWKCLFRRDTFHNFHTQWKISNFEKTYFTIPKKWNYTKGVSWRDTFHNFKKIGFILKVSLQETLSTISIHNRIFQIYAKGVSSRDTFHKRKKKLYLLISITCYTTKCLKFIPCIHYNQYFDIQSKTNENK